MSLPDAHLMSDAERKIQRAIGAQLNWWVKAPSLSLDDCIAQSVGMSDFDKIDRIHVVRHPGSPIPGVASSLEGPVT